MLNLGLVIGLAQASIFARAHGEIMASAQCVGEISNGDVQIVVIAPVIFDYAGF